MLMSISHSTMMQMQRNIGAANASTTTCIERLSSGMRINKAADAPADFIEAEKLESKIKGLEKAIENTRTTDNILGVAEGALGEVGGLLQRMRQLSLHAKNTGATSKEQIAADQAELDRAVQSVDRIFGTANYAGEKLLDDTALGRKIASIAGGNLFGKQHYVGERALLDPDEAAAMVDTYSRDGLDVDAGSTLFDANGALLQDYKVVLQNGGADGSDAEYRFSAGTGIDDILAALSAPPTAAAASPADPSAKKEDVPCLSFDARVMDVAQKLDPEQARTYLNNVMTSAARTAAERELVLNQLTDAERKELEAAENLASLNASTLGSVRVAVGTTESGKTKYQTLSLNDLLSGGRASLERDADAADAVLKKAASEIVSARGSIGAARSVTLRSTENTLMKSLENHTKALSFLRDTDMALTSIQFTNSSVLGQFGTRMLATVQEHNQSILNLLA